MKIRVVKPIAPIKINNHWVYRVDDTVEIGLDEFCGILANEHGTNRMKREQVMELLEQYLQSKLESK